MNTLLKNSLLAALIATLLFLSHPAFAADSTTNNYRVYGTAPYLLLDSTSASNRDWSIVNNHGSYPNYLIIQSTDGITYRKPFVIEDSADSNLLYLDSAEFIGINTNVPAVELDIHSSSPVIRLDDTSSGQGRVDLDMSVHEFAIQGNTDQEIVEIDTRASSRSLTINLDGEVGIGASSPGPALYVWGNGDDEAAQVSVYNYNGGTPGAARKLFRIQNRIGPAKFSMWSGLSDEWAFNARTDVFRISKQGTGSVEMELNQNGNLTITGTLSHGSSRTIKHDIVAVDTKKVLDQVLAMPVAEWTYNHDKDTVRHMGPMSEDFHQTFGLGDSDKKLTTIDTSGVALAAIQGLSKVVEEKDREIEALRTEMGELRAMVQTLIAKDKIALSE